MSNITICREDKHYDFWMPDTQTQIIDWLTANYPTNQLGEPIDWSAPRYRKALRAIYVSRRIYLEQRHEKENTYKNREEEIQLTFEFDTSRTNRIDAGFERFQQRFQRKE